MSSTKHVVASKNASKNPQIHTDSSEKMEVVDELVSSDASSLPPTRTSGGEADAPSGADTLNPEGTESTKLGVDKLETSVDGSTPLSKKALKRRKQKERRQTLSALSRVSLSQEGGSKEGPPGTSGNTSDSGAVERSEESRKRSRIPGDTPELVQKKARTYSQAAKKGITLKITCKDDNREVSEADSIFIASAIEEHMFLAAGRIQPQVERNILRSDGLYISCRDQKTLDWLKTVVNDLSPPEEDHPGFIALGPGDRPPMRRFYVWFPGPREPARSVRLLEICNGLEPKKIIIRAVIPGEGGNTLVLGVATEMLELLKKNDYSLYCGLGKVHFRDPVPKKPELEAAPEKVTVESTSQVSSDTESLNPPNFVSPLLRDEGTISTEISVLDSGAVVEVPDNFEDLT